jgi:hypothetical protein
MSTIGRRKRVAVEIGGGGSVLSARALADDDEPNVVEVEYVPAAQLEGAVALLKEVRSRSRRPFGGHAPYDLAVRIERFLDDGVYEPHPDAGGR